MTLRGFAAVLFLLAASTASAHHSATMFEQTKTIILERVVRSFHTAPRTRGCC